MHGINRNGQVRPVVMGPRAVARNEYRPEAMLERAVEEGMGLYDFPKVVQAIPNLVSSDYTEMLTAHPEIPEYVRNNRLFLDRLNLIYVEKHNGHMNLATFEAIAKGICKDVNKIDLSKVDVYVTEYALKRIKPVTRLYVILWPAQGKG